MLVKDVPLDYNKECLSAFLWLKAALISAPVMQAPDQDFLFEVMCDASDYTLRAIMGQREDNNPYAIYYTSQTLDEAQVNYATTKKEFLAVVIPWKNFVHT